MLLPACTSCCCSAVEQLVEVSQTRAIADALVKLRRRLSGGGASWRSRTLAQLLDLLEAEMNEQARLGCSSLVLAVLLTKHSSWSSSIQRATNQPPLSRCISINSALVCRCACRVWMRWRGGQSQATWRARGASSWRRRSTG
jgi:hypothetical protein